MLRVLSILGWAKTNGVMLAAVLSLITASYIVGNMRGYKSGNAVCEAKYTERDNQRLTAINHRLDEIQAENTATWKQWIESNERLASEVADKIENKETTILEIPVEKVVTVEPDCSISYSVIGVLDETAAATRLD